MGRFENKGRAKAVARGAAPAQPSIQRRVEVRQEDMHAMAIGTRNLTREVGGRLAESAVSLNGYGGLSSGLIAVAMGAGAMLAGVVDAMEQYVVDKAAPPEWYLALRSLVDTPQVDTTGPVKDEDDLQKRAAASDLVIAPG